MKVMKNITKKSRSTVRMDLHGLSKQPRERKQALLDKEDTTSQNNEGGMAIN